MSQSFLMTVTVNVQNLGVVVEMVKLDELVPVPAGVVTATMPLVAPAGTVAVICVPLTTVYVVAEAPLKATLVAPVKLVPISVTDVPAAPEVGEKFVIVGGDAGGVPTVKLDALVPVPAGAVTAILPVVAPLGTVAVI